MVHQDAQPSTMRARSSHEASSPKAGASRPRHGVWADVMSLPTELGARVLAHAGTAIPRGFTQHAELAAVIRQMLGTPELAGIWLINKYGMHQALIKGASAQLTPLVEAVVVRLMSQYPRAKVHQRHATDCSRQPLTIAQSEAAQCIDLALKCASKAGLVGCVKQLLCEHGADVHAFREGALWEASQQGHVAVVAVLLEAGAHVDEDHGAALRAAAAAGHEAVVAALLLAAGTHAAPKAEHGLALLSAAEGGHAGVVRQLLAAGVRPWRNTLQRAAENGHVQVMQLLLGLPSNQPNAYVLRAAIERRQKTCVQWLLDVTHLTFNGWPSSLLLEKVAAAGWADVAKQLLDRGADPNEGRGAPLVAAAQAGHMEVVEVLLQAGAQTDPAQRSTWDTALWQAACHDHAQVVERLLAAGASVRDYTSKLRASLKERTQQRRSHQQLSLQPQQNQLKRQQSQPQPQRQSLDSVWGAASSSACGAQAQDGHPSTVSQVQDAGGSEVAVADGETGSSGQARVETARQLNVVELMEAAVRARTRTDAVLRPARFHASLANLQPAWMKRLCRMVCLSK